MTSIHVEPLSVGSPCTLHKNNPHVISRENLPNQSEQFVVITVVR